MSNEISLDAYVRAELKAVALADAKLACERLHKYAPPKIVETCAAAAYEAVINALAGSRVNFPSAGGGGQGAKLSEESEYQIWEQLGLGRSPARIAADLEVDTSTVFRVRKRMLSYLQGKSELADVALAGRPHARREVKG